MNTPAQVTPENRSVNPLALLCDAAEHALRHPEDYAGFYALMQQARRIMDLNPEKYPNYIWLDAALMKVALANLAKGGVL